MFNNLFLVLSLITIFGTQAYATSHELSSSCVEGQQVSINRLLDDQKEFAIKEHSHSHGNDFHAKWSGAEHKQLGDLGFVKACLELDIKNSACTLNQIHRADGKLAMSYGQVVALGDFYLDPEKAFLETKRLSSIGKLFHCIDKEGKVHDIQKENPEIDYPDCTWVNVLYGGDYLNVVSNNMDHFAWDNIKAYAKFHNRAIRYAEAAHRARKQKDYDLEDLLLNKALYLNAFADHFLTDAFPAGHLRVPRAEIKKWAKKRIGGLLHSFIADGLAMLLHDNEGKNFSSQEVGIDVANSLGVEWTTRSDKNLNICAKESDPHIQMPMLSVQNSVKEVLYAYEYGIAHEGVYSAVNYVPFPNDFGIIDRWRFLLNSPNADSSIRRMRNELPIPIKWIVKTEHIKKLFSELPQILGSFRDRVSKDLQTNDTLQKRLPSAYIENFKNLK